MTYGPRILNLRLCFMKCRVIRYTRSNLSILVLHSQIVWVGRVIDAEFRIEISDSHFRISHVNRLDIWITIIKKNSKLCWISTSENWIIIQRKFFLWGSSRLEFQKSLRVWFIWKKWLVQSRGALNRKAKVFCNCI